MLIESFLWLRRGFGFANLAALLEGQQNCRGEEHTVEVVRSGKSGKIKRIYWNKRSITDFFRASGASGASELKWKARSGETLQIVKTTSKAGFDLLVDGTRFSELPSFGQLGQLVSVSQTSEDRCPRDSHELERLPMSELSEPNDFSVISDLDSDPFQDATLNPPRGQPQQNADFRLSMMADFSSSEDCLQDELHSELYSPLLESLRIQITSCLPQTEEMISRAIMNAFFRESGSEDSFSLSVDSADAVDPFQVEVDCLWEAIEWVRLNVDYAPRPDTEELALNLFQKRVDDIFCRVRHEELASDEAARILLSVAAALGLKFASRLPQTTLILDGLEKGITQDDIHDRLASFGDIEATAIAKVSSRFGFCRFYHEESASKVLQYVSSTHNPLLGKSKVSVSVLRENLVDGLHPFSRVRTQPEPLSATEELPEEDGVDCPPPPPVDTTPHLMGPLCSEESLRLLGSPVCVSQAEFHPSFSAFSAEESICDAC